MFPENPDSLVVDEEVPIRDPIAHQAGVESMVGHTRAAGEGGPVEGFRNYLLKYDRYGHRTLHEQFNRDGTLVKRWRYDGDGKLVEEVSFDGSGNLDYRFEVIYDGSNWKEKRMFSPPDKLHYRIVTERDADGRLVRATYLNAAGDTVRADSYVYDAHGLVTRVDMASLGQRHYEYDQSSNLTRKRIDLPGASAYGDIYEFEYDARRLLTQMEHLHLSVTTFSYSFF